MQRGLTRLGFDTKVNGKFDELTCAAIARWQEEQSYPATGFLNAAQQKALADAAAEAGKSGRRDRRRAGGRARYSRGVGGPIGAIGGAVHGVVGRGGRTIPQVTWPRVCLRGERPLIRRHSQCTASAFSSRTAA